MSPDRPRPPRIHRDPVPTSGFRSVTFRMVSGPDYRIEAPADQVTELLEELRATWRHETYNSFTFGSLETGTYFLLNPAHVVAVDVR